MFKTKAKVIIGLTIAVASSVSALSMLAASGAVTVSDEAFRYECKFYDFDESLLYVCYVKPSHDAIYKGKIPSRPETDYYKYEFKQWNKPTYGIDSDTEFYPQFDQITKDYTIIFANSDGTLLQNDWCQYGETPQYRGETPEKASDDFYSYVFKGWDKDPYPANNDDSTFAISDKVYDRAMTMNLNTKAARYKSNRNSHQIHLSATKFNELIADAINAFPLSEDGLKKVKDFDNYLVSEIHITFGNRIMMQLKKYVPIYVACGGTEIKAIDDIICTKILRKLEAQNPIFIKLKANEIILKLDEIFGQDQMVDCIRYVNTLSASI